MATHGVPREGGGRQAHHSCWHGRRDMPQHNRERSPHRRRYRRPQDTEEKLRREAIKGASTMLPLLIGYLPLALTIGVAAGASADPSRRMGRRSPDLRRVRAPRGDRAGRKRFWRGGRRRHRSADQRQIDGLQRLVAVTVARGPAASPPARRRVVIDPMWLIARRRQAQPGTTGERRAFFGGAAATLAAGWSAMIGAGTLLGTPQVCDVVPWHLYAVVLVGHRRASPANCGRRALCLRCGRGRGVDIVVAVGDRTSRWRWRQAPRPAAGGRGGRGR